MELNLNPDNFEIIGFYPYPSTPRDLIGEYDDGLHYTGNIKIKELFESLMNTIDSHQKYSMRDNKTTIKAKYIPTGEIYYIGLKDWYYRLGKSVFQEIGTEILFDKSSPYWIRNYTKNKNIC